MPKLKSGTILPTPEEDAAITAAAMSDPDARPMTDEEWQQAKPQARVGGRPPLPPEQQKVKVTLRLDRDVLEALRASGRGWQTRVNATLREAVKR